MSDTLHSSLGVGKPPTMSQFTTGELFFVNGVGKPQRWNGSDAASENAGIPRPPSGLSFYVAGSGSVEGLYTAAVRFVDAEGVPGDLSTAVTVSAVNNSMFYYKNLPIPTDSRVTKREVYRTLAGNARTFYLDKTVNDVLSTAATSSASDSVLGLRFALPELNNDGSLHARRFGVPPTFKTVVVSHQERTFWLVDVVLNRGHAEVTNGSATVTIVGEPLSAQLVGLEFHVDGHATIHTISATGSTTITLSTNYTGSTDKIAKYTIRPPVSERNQAYFSENSEPESVPSVNAAKLQQDEGDAGELIAGMPLGAFLWLQTPTRTYRWTFNRHPINDGGIYLTTHRGSVGQRCWVQVEGDAYVMDREGCYVFNGGTAQPISQDIQDLFRPGGGIVWHNSRFFHASYYPAEETVKFFVCLDGSYYPRHALCYHYRKGSWWTEEYPWEVSSADVARVEGFMRLVTGGPYAKLYLASEGTLDGPKKLTNGWLAVSSATHSSCTVAAGSFIAADITDAMLHIVTGKGKGQKRKIISASASSGRIDVWPPWTIKPDSTSTTQVGGVAWHVKTKWLRYVESGEETSHNYRLSFTGTTKSASMDLRRYENHSKTPKNFDVTYDRQDGAKVTRDSPDVEIDMVSRSEGWTYWSFDEHRDFRGPSSRFMQAELRGVQNMDIVMVHALGIDGVRE